MSHNQYNLISYTRAFPPQVLPQMQGLTRLEVAATAGACLPTELGHTLSCCPGLRHLDISGWPVRGVVCVCVVPGDGWVSQSS